MVSSKAEEFRQMLVGLPNQGSLFEAVLNALDESETALEEAEGERDEARQLGRDLYSADAIAEWFYAEEPLPAWVRSSSPAKKDPEPGPMGHAFDDGGRCHYCNRSRLVIPGLDNTQCTRRPMPQPGGVSDAE